MDDTITGGSQTDPAGTSPATDPWNLVLNAEPPLGKTVASRNVSLNEEFPTRICWDPATSLTVSSPLPPGLTEAQAIEICSLLQAGAEPAGPKAAKLGVVDLTNPNAPAGIPLMWTDTAMGVTKQVTLQSGVTLPVTVTENPTAKFDIAGLYVWHCHILEHEDNEMMRPFVVSNAQIYLPLILNGI